MDDPNAEVAGWWGLAGGVEPNTNIPGLVAAGSVDPNTDDEDAGASAAGVDPNSDG